MPQDTAGADPLVTLHVRVRRSALAVLQEVKAETGLPINAQVVEAIRDYLEMIEEDG